MVDLLISILAALGYPVRLQGSLAPDEPYPDAFFTFWNNSSADGAHYDNGPINFIWDFDVTFYATDPALVYSALEEARAALRAAGFILSGKGQSVPSDEPTHTGRGLNALYIETETQNGGGAADPGNGEGGNADPGEGEGQDADQNKEEE